MSTEIPSQVTCPSCGRSGKYRPEMAGRTLKCKCGAKFDVPAAPEESSQDALAVEPVQSPQDDHYDIHEPPADPKKPVSRPPDVLSYRTTQSAPEPENKAEVFPTFFRPKTYSQDIAQQQSQAVKIAILLLVIAVVIGGSIFGIKFLRGPVAAAGPQLGEDADIQAKLDGEYHKEIHDWFQQDPDRMLGPWSKSQALTQADRWQQQGAKQVIAFGSRMSLVAVIELPDNSAQRKAIFDWQADWHRQHMQRVWTDVGQKYLMIRLGI